MAREGEGPADPYEHVDARKHVIVPKGLPAGTETVANAAVFLLETSA